MGGERPRSDRFHGLKHALAHSLVFVQPRRGGEFSSAASAGVSDTPELLFTDMRMRVIAESVTEGGPLSSEATEARTASMSPQLLLDRKDIMLPLRPKVGLARPACGIDCATTGDGEDWKGPTKKDVVIDSSWSNDDRSGIGEFIDILLAIGTGGGSGSGGDGCLAGTNIRPVLLGISTGTPEQPSSSSLETHREFSDLTSFTRGRGLGFLVLREAQAFCLSEIIREPSLELLPLLTAWCTFLHFFFFDRFGCRFAHV